jgi:hypothetical protein
MVALIPQTDEDLGAFYVRIYNDPVVFARALWADRNLTAKAPVGWVEADIIRWIAGVDENNDWLTDGCDPETGKPFESQRRVCLAHRSIGKTYMGSAVVAWLLFRNPNEKVLIDSKSEGQAKRTLKMITTWFRTVWFLQSLQVRKDLGQRDNALMYDVGPSAADGGDYRTPSISAMGIEGQLTSSRATFVLSDDVETKKNTKTDTAREDLREDSTEHAAICSYGRKQIVYIGTFHHEESLYLDLMERGYLLRSWPFEYPKPGDAVVNLAPALQARLDTGEAQPGDIVVHYRFNEQDRRQQMAEGTLYYAMQYRLLANLADEDKYPLKLRDLIVMNVDRQRAPVHVSWGTRWDRGGSTVIDDIPSMGFHKDKLHQPIKFDQEWKKYAGTKMWIDPSGKGADNTGYAIVSQLHGFLWVHEVGGLRDGYSNETLRHLAARARFYDVSTVYVEYDMGGGMFEPLLQPKLEEHFLDPGEHPDYPNGWKCAIICDGSTSARRVGGGGRKEERIIRALEGPLSQHRIVVDPEVIRPKKSRARERELQYQMTRITEEPNCLRHDDEVESLAMCVQMWRDDLRVDPGEQARRHKEQEFDKMLEEHYRQCGLSVPSKRFHRPKGTAHADRPIISATRLVLSRRHRLGGERRVRDCSGAYERLRRAA